MLRSMCQHWLTHRYVMLPVESVNGLFDLYMALDVSVLVLVPVPAPVSVAVVVVVPDSVSHSSPVSISR